MAGNRPNAKAIALLVAVFVLGGVLGGLGTYLAGHMRTPNRRQRFLDQMTVQLQLTPAQKAQVQSIFSEERKRWLAVVAESQRQARLQVRPQLDAIHQDTHARIMAILTPAQQKKFTDWLARIAAEHAAHPRRPAPPAPNPPPAPTASRPPQSH